MLRHYIQHMPLTERTIEETSTVLEYFRLYDISYEFYTLDHETTYLDGWGGTEDEEDACYHKLLEQDIILDREE